MLAVAQRTFLLVAVVSIGAYLARHAEDLRSLLTWRLAWHCAAAAVVLAALHPLIAWGFYQLQRFNGIAIDFPTSLGIYMRRIPARYVPGGIWHSVSRLADMHWSSNVAAGLLRRQFLLEVGVVAGSGLLTCALGLWCLPDEGAIRTVAAVQAATGLGALLIAAAMLFRRARSWHLLLAWLLYVLIWLLAATAFAVLSAGLSMGARECHPASTVSAYLVSAVQGYLAVFAPQGWGVTEASFAIFDPCARPVREVLAAFLLYRLSGMVGDAVGYLVWALSARSSPPCYAQTPPEVK
ncbi:MAG TPA: hypothetical protein PLN91_05560 [Rhodanobacteraceae bacterium]|nr:hypothetical protein [Rhodanobacteraceae bacterium]